MLSLAVAAGCGDGGGDGAGADAAAPAGIFVGTVEGTDAYIGIKSDGETAGGYLCNGRGLSEKEILSVWLDESEIDAGSAVLTDRDGQTVGEVTLSEAKATGEVEIDGETLAFSAAAATGEAGIYSETKAEPGEPESSETGWIVLDDGSLRGVRSINDGTSNTVKPASPRPPSSGYIDPTSDI